MLARRGNINGAQQIIRSQSSFGCSTHRCDDDDSCNHCQQDEAVTMNQDNVMGRGSRDECGSAGRKLGKYSVFRGSMHHCKLDTGLRVRSTIY